MGWRDLLRDNPVLVKHLRARLRRPESLVAVLAVLVVAGGIYYLMAENTVADGAAFAGLVALQGAILFLLGTAQVTSSLGQARESGMLEFHRASPQPAARVAAGFLLGAPVREYLLFTATVPFSLICLARGCPSVTGFLLLLLVLLLAALLYHTVAALAALLFPRVRGTGAGLGALFLFLNTGSTGAHAALGALTVGPAYRELTPQPVPPEPATFYGVPVSHLLLALLHQLPLLLFLLVPVVRRLGRERAPLYSKTTAAAFHGTIGFLLLGDVWGQSPVPHFPLVVTVYGVAATAMLLCGSVTPDREGVESGGHRARRVGRPAPGPWEDPAPNGRPLLVFTAVTLLTGSLALFGTPHRSDLGLAALAPAVVGAAAVLAFGSAWQLFALRARGTSRPRWNVALGAFVVLAWLMPPFLAGRLAAAGPGSYSLRQGIAAASPLTGIWLATGESAGGPPVVAVALCCSVVTAAVLVLLRRRAEREVWTALSRAEPAGDGLAAGDGARRAPRAPRP